MDEKTELRRIENKEWLDSLRYVLEEESTERGLELLRLLHSEALKKGISASELIKTSYINTISTDEEKPYPGDEALESKLMALIRWNAMAMVVKANRRKEGTGGHISTYGSIANLWEVGFNHFFKISDEKIADSVYFQGHASPGIYARAFLEGRIDEIQLKNFRRELQDEPGLTSYPHPRLMPDFWKFPTVSMGLASITAIYRARFDRYMFQRGLIEKNDSKVWAFMGDGEMDEPESRGAISLAARENLGNLIFVIDCNLQRLDGPVRGNRKIIDELETLFKGAGWKVIKVLWGRDWDKVLDGEQREKLIRRLNTIPDGELQKMAHEEGGYLRDKLFGDDEELSALVADFSDEELKKWKRGGHDPHKIYQAYSEAINTEDQPVIVLAQTIKGYGQGKAGEAGNVSHKTKKLSSEELKAFRDFFNVPIEDDDLDDLPFLRPDEDSEEIRYLKERREKLGGFLPAREDLSSSIEAPDPDIFKEFLEGSGDDEVATTMALMRMMGKLYESETIGDLLVPIIPDESRTFGMESLFSKMGIYAPDGQKYDPVDEESLLYYNEQKDGAILEEGISEAGCMSSFIAAGTSHYTHGINTIPFYFFYSMFGFQRTGDLMWAAADAGARGFLVGGIAGRTSIPGEGLQHQDGQSHLNALAFPNLMAYDPAFAFEIAIIIRDGIKRMYSDKEKIFYYLTVGNDTYPMPPKPEKVEEGILKGIYRFKESNLDKGERKAHLLGSGAIMKEVLAAAEILEEDYSVAVDIWSVTSYKALYDDAIDTERKNRLEAKGKEDKCFVQKAFKDESGVVVAATDYVKALPLSIAPWLPVHLTVLGTDGFGRSEAREELREYFEVDRNHIAYAAILSLVKTGRLAVERADEAAEKLKINKEKINPRTV
jgi:pyruvate dehydrogenase E1 component